MGHTGRLPGAGRRLRIPLPLPNDGLRAVNVYVIDDGDGLVLIDGGWALAESQQQLERGLAELDFKLADIRKFLVTHIHRDHYSQAISVRRLVGSHVSLGLGEKPSLDLIMSPDRDAMHPFARRMIIAGAFDLNGASAMATVANAEERFDYEAPDTWLTPGLVELKSRSPSRWSRHLGTPPGTSCFMTWPPGCCSPAITCCRALRRRSGSNRERLRYHSPITWTRCAWCARGPTPDCYRLTVPSLRACTRERRAVGPSREAADRVRGCRRSTVRAPVTRSPSSCSGRAANTACSTWTSSTSQWRSARPSPTSTCASCAGGSPALTTTRIPPAQARRRSRV